ncbi:MAG TPA: SufD family Fe-S cluster assembly protein [Dehalococcoidia bacterium]|nr:SufD family Fe-S cluster assembly protein [Dehalococcoidia bacterium]
MSDEVKKASTGNDIDLSLYESQTAEKPSDIDPSSLSDEDKQQMMSAGIMLEDLSQRSGTYIQIDNAPVHSSVKQDGIEVMAISQALDKYGWLKDYFWRAVAADTDKYTEHVDSHRSEGYFIRALPGSKTLYPVQACLYLAKNHLVQDVHNIVIAEEGSELHIITGCTTAAGKEAGIHLGVSEFYIKKGAKITFSMIHSWTPDTGVRPRTSTVIEEDGLFLSNYIIMKPVRSLQAYPSAICNGKNATVRFNSVMVATPGSNMDLGSKVFLNADGSKAEIVSRAITTGGDIIARGYIEGNHPESKGHLECRGLIMGDSGNIHAIPELKGSVAGVDLSHEAAVGKIAEEEIEYLMARGLSRDEATATIVRGFLNVDIEGLPPMLHAEMKKAIEASEQDLF